MSFNTTHIGNVNFIGQFLFTDGNGTVTIRDGYITLSDGYTGQPAIRFDNAAATGIYSPEPDTIGFVIDAQERVILDQDGYLGINTSAPVEYLTVDGVLAVSPQVEPPPDATFGKIYQKNDGVLYFKNSAGAEFDLTAGDVGGGSPVSGTGGAGRVTFWTGSTTITGDTDLFWNNTTKRLGIGNAAPTQDLDVTGTIIAQLMILEQAGEPELAFRNTALANNPEFNIGRVANVDGTAAFRILFDNDVVSERTVYSIDADGRSIYTRQTDGVFFDAEIAGETNPLFTLTSTNNGGIEFRDTNADVPADVLLGRTGPGRLKISGLGSTESGVLDTDVVLSQDGYLSISAIAPMPQFVGTGETYIGSALEVDGYVWLREGAGISGDVSISGLLEVDGYILPERDNIYDLGALDRRWHNVYTGPNSFHIFATDDETEVGEERDWVLGINGMGDLTISQSEDHHVFVTSGGQVGVGVSDPQGEIHVDGFGVFNSGVRLGNYLSETTSLLKNVSGEVSVRNAADSDYTRIISKTIHLGSGSLAEPSLAFISSTGTGIYRPANNAIGFVTANLEHMRIHPSGVISIGSTVAPTPPIKVSITGGGISVDGNSLFGTGTVNEQVTIAGRLSLQETTIPTNTGGFGKLYVSSADNDLHYLDSAGVDINLTADGGDITAFDGYAGRIPYFSSTSVLKGDKDFIWDPINERLGIATSTPQAKIEIQDGYVDSFLKTPAIQITGGAQEGYVLKSGADGYASWAPGISAAAEGADGYVAFFTGPSGIAGDNDLFWDRAGNRLGIGTSTPTKTLEVKGKESGDGIRIQDVTGSTSLWSMLGSSTTRLETSGVLQLRHGAQLDLQTGASTVLRLTGSKVGIGPAITPTLARLEVVENASSPNAIAATLALVGNTTGVAGIGLGSSITTYIENDFSTNTLASAITTKWVSASSGSESSSMTFGLKNAGSNTTPLFINNDGKVGIGTLDPQSQLDVAGGVAIGSTYAGVTASPTDGLIIEGQVGIGTDSPTTTTSGVNRLHIAVGSLATAAAANNGDVIVIDTTSTSLINFRTNTAAAGTFGLYFSDNVRGAGSLEYSHSTDSMAFRVGANPRVGFYATGVILGNGLGYTAPANRLDVSGAAAIGSAYATVETAPTDGLLVQGNVGIRTANPEANLHVAGDGYFDGYLNPYQDDMWGLGHPDRRWRDLYLGPGSLHIIGKSAEVGTYRDWAMDLASDGRLRIRQGAHAEEFLFGLSASGSSGTPAFEVKKTAENYGNKTVPFASFEIAGDGNVLRVKAGTTGDSAQEIFQVLVGSTSIFKVDGNNTDSGRVSIGNVTTAQNKLDVSGSVGIGSSYAGVSAAPTDGLIVEGRTVIGATSSVSFGGVNSPLTVTSGNGAQTAIVANNTTASGDPVFVTAISGVTKWGFGVDNSSTNDDLRIFPDGPTSGRGMTGRWTGGGDIQFGINTTDPNSALDVRVASNLPTNTQNVASIVLEAAVTPGTGFGPGMAFAADNSAISLHQQAFIATRWDNATAGSEDGRLEIGVTDNSTANSNIIVIDKNGMAVLNDSVAPRSALDVGGDGYFDGYVVADHFRLPELGVAPTQVDEHGLLYVSSADNNLHYVDSSGTDFDLTPDGQSVGATQGADGYVAFFTGPSGIAGDNDLFWDRANNRLGIHTETPQNFLDVAGGMAIGAGFAGSSTAPANSLIIDRWLGLNTDSPETSIHISQSGSVPSGAAALNSSTFIAIDSNASGYIEFRRGTGNSGSYGLLFTDDVAVVGGITYGFAGNAFQFKMNNALYGIWDSTGLGVGFGSVAAINTLDVRGNAAIGTTYGGLETAPTDGLLVEGDVAIGTTSPGIYNLLLGNVGETPFATERYAGSASPTRWSFRRARGNESSPADVQDGDPIGTLSFQGYEGAGFKERLAIQAEVNGTVSSGDIPIDLVFFGNTGSGIVERMRLTGGGNLTFSGADNVEGKINFAQNTGSTAPPFIAGRSTNDSPDGIMIDLRSANNETIIGLKHGTSAGVGEIFYNNGLNFANASNATVLHMAVDGYVGLKTTDPQAHLHVAGNAIFDGYIVAGNLTMPEGSAPSQIDDHGRLYVNAADNNLHFIDSSGVDFDLTPDGQAVGATEGADGYIAFFTGPSGIAGDNDLFWDRENNRLGLHTQTPQNFLDVAGGVAIGSTYAGVDTAPEDSLIIEGQLLVGLNTSTGDHIIQASTTSGLVGRFESDDATRSQMAIVNTHATGDPVIALVGASGALGIFGYDKTEESMVFNIGTSSNTPGTPSTSNTLTRMVIDGNTGNVGIGLVYDPEAKLHVDGDGYFDGYLNPYEDNRWGLGSTDRRWSDLAVGPDSINIISKATENNVGVDRFWKVKVRSEDGYLDIGHNADSGIIVSPAGDVAIQTTEYDQRYGLNIQKSIAIGGEGVTKPNITNGLFVGGQVLISNSAVPDDLTDTSTSKNARLVLEGNNDIMLYMKRTGSGGSAILLEGSQGSSLNFEASGTRKGAVGFLDSDTSLRLGVASSYPGLGGASDRVVILGSSGNVGIGTATPQSRLDVNGGVVIGSTFAGVSAAPTDGLLVEGGVRFGEDLSIANSLLTVSDTDGDRRYIVINNSGTGDAFFSAAVGGSIAWSFGVDNDDNDKLRIVPGGNPGAQTTGLFGNLTSEGVFFGINDSSPSTALVVVSNTSKTNSAEGILTLTHTTSGTAEDGFGSAISFRNEKPDTVLASTARISGVWKDAGGSIGSLIFTAGTGTSPFLEDMARMDTVGMSILKGKTIAQSALDVGGDGYFDGYVVADHFRLPEIDDAPAAIDKHGLLYVKTSDNNLHYVDSSGTDFDLTPNGQTVGSAEGADGYVTFYTGASGIAGDNDLFWDRANNRLGIHTQTPQNFLDVAGGVAIGAAFAGSSTAPANSLIIDRWLGLNTDSPETSIHISQSGSVPSGAAALNSSTFIAIDSNASGYIEFRRGTGNSGSYGLRFTDDVASPGAITYQFSNNTFEFRLNTLLSGIWNSTGLGIAPGGISAINTLDIGGNVAIGSTYAGTSTAPTDGLIVEGQVGIGIASLTSESTNRLHIEANPNTTGAAAATGDTILIDGGSASSLINFRANTGTGGTYGLFFSDETRGVGELSYVHGANRMTIKAAGVPIASFFSTGLALGTAFTAPANMLDVSGASVIGSAYATVETAPADGLLVQGNVGIRTANPEANLHVAGDGYFDGYLNPYQDDMWGLGSSVRRWRDLYVGPNSLHIIGKPAEVGVDRDWIVGLNSGGHLNVKQGSDNALLIASTGGATVGGGTTLPGQVSGSDIQLKIEGRTGQSRVYMTGSQNYIYFANGAAYLKWFAGTPFELKGSTDDILLNTASGQNSLFIAKTSNNVGLGTATPQNRLDVSGGVAIGSTFAGVETVDTDGLWVEGKVKIGATTDLSAISGATSLITTNSGAANYIAANNNSTGDAWFSTSVSGSVKWSFGYDQSDDRMRLISSANPASGTNDETGLIGVASGSNASFGINIDPQATFHIAQTTTGTSATGPMIYFTNRSSGTPEAGFGAGFAFQHDDASNILSLVTALDGFWRDAVSRIGSLAISTYNNNSRVEVARFDEVGISVLKGFTIAQSALDVGGDGYFDGYVVADHFRLPELDDSIDTIDDFSSLFVKAADSDLYYKDRLGNETNISGPPAPLYTITAVKTGATNANFDEVVRCDPSGGGFTVTLPDASTNIGQTIIVKNTTNSTNTITIQGTGGDTIDGLSSVTIEEGYRSITFVSYSATEWGRV